MKFTRYYPAFIDIGDDEPETFECNTLDGFLADEWLQRFSTKKSFIKFSIINKREFNAYNALMVVGEYQDKDEPLIIGFLSDNDINLPEYNK